MTLHIGIVGCSAEGAALCYRTICAEGAKLLGAHAHPEISMHTPSLSEYVSYLEANNLRGVGEMMLASASKLANAGADFLICPDNTVHKAFSLVESRSPLPWLHIADVVASRAVDLGFQRLGLTGTKWLVESNVYPENLAAKGLGCIHTNIRERIEINRIIMDELVNGIFEPQAISYMQQTIERFKMTGCDAVILGCTELPLIIDDSNCVLPTLDSTRLLATAALHRAVQGS